MTPLSRYLVTLGQAVRTRKPTWRDMVPESFSVTVYQEEEDEAGLDPLGEADPGQVDDHGGECGVAGS